MKAETWSAIAAWASAVAAAIALYAAYKQETATRDAALILQEKLDAGKASTNIQLIRELALGRNIPNDKQHFDTMNKNEVNAATELSALRCTEAGTMLLNLQSIDGDSIAKKNLFDRFTRFRC